MQNKRQHSRTSDFLIKLLAVGLLFTALSGSPALAAASGCVSQFVYAADRSAIFERLADEIDSGFPGRDQARFYLGDSRGKSSRWVREILGDISLLDDLQRHELLSRLDAAAGRFVVRERPSDFALALKFALHDEETWLSHIEDLARRGTYGDELLVLFPPALRTMPTPLAQKVHRRIAELYPAADKSGTKTLPAKRALDAILRHTIPVEQFFSTRTGAGAAAKKAYGAYLSALSVVFPKTGSIGGYGVNQVLAASRAIQKSLRDPALRRNIPNPELILTGSFPNGRAKLASSDLDVFLSDPRLEAIFKRTDAEVAAVIAGPAGDPSRIGLYLHQAPENWSPWEMGRINPLQLRITAEEIELLVYPPFTTTHRDITLSGARAPLPLRFSLGPD